MFDFWFKLSLSVNVLLRNVFIGADTHSSSFVALHRDNKFVCDCCWWKRWKSDREEGQKTDMQEGLDLGFKREEKWKSLWSAARDGIKSPLFHYHPVAAKVEVQCVSLQGFVSHWKAQCYTHTCIIYFCSKTRSSRVLYEAQVSPGFALGQGWDSYIPKALKVSVCVQTAIDYLPCSDH